MSTRSGVYIATRSRSTGPNDSGTKVVCNGAVLYAQDAAPYPVPLILGNYALVRGQRAQWTAIMIIVRRGTHAMTPITGHFGTV